MEQLSRTVSTESSRSWTTPHPLASGSGSSPVNRKARSSEPETGGSNVERASVSMPPPASKSIAIARQFPSRRTSKASDSSFNEPVGSARHSSAIDEVEATPTPTPATLEAARHGSHGTAHSHSYSQALSLSLALPDAAFYRSKSDADAESNRMSLSSLYSLGSAIINTSRGLSGPSSLADSEPEAKVDLPSHGTTTATSSFSVTTSSQNGSLGPSLSPTQLLHPMDHTSPPGYPPQPQAHNGPVHPTSPQLGPPPTSNPNTQARRSRSRTTAQRRISGSTGASSSPGSRDVRDLKRPTKGVIGVCALESKARSKPARNIFGKLVEDFDVKIFGDKIILDEDVENWPVCDFLISFFSDGFPLDKAIAYVRLRKPFCVNDLPMQQVLWDRRLCLQILDKLNIPTPKRVEINRDGGPRLQSSEFARILFDRTGISLPGASDGTGGGTPPPQAVELVDDGNTIRVDGISLSKPFVEKPVSGEDHNINIYYHKKDGGGGRKLFRKVNNKSSEKDDTLDVPRSFTDRTSSYIYEKFLQVENSEDVKAYTVGPNFCHAETRKSPVVDGLVKRNPSGKEVRYVTKLSDTEAIMASKISEGFGQRVCGFDLLRCGDTSFVIDVNGWSFVKDNGDYYDKAATILKDMFLKEIQRKERKDGQVVVDSTESLDKPSASRKPTGSHRQALKGIFKSPSMSKLRDHHPHIRSGNHSGTVSSSPDTSLSATPLISSPSFEKTFSAAMASAPSALRSEPDLLLPPTSQEKDLGLDIKTSVSDDQITVPPPASKAQWKLKGVVAVVRHADRTPKQKFKYTFHTKPFVDLLKGHQEEVLLIGEAALQSVSDAVKLAIQEGVEDPKKLRELRIYLNKKGGWPGTKVQIKPMFRKRRKDELPPGSHAEDSPEMRRVGSSSGNASDGAAKRSDSMSGVTLSRISAAENNLVLDKLQLIIKWGGEPTHSARHQAQDMAANFRNDLLLMNRDVLDDVSVFSSSERRSTTSAQIFAATFQDMSQYPEENISIRKDLLDDSNAAKDEMDKVKKKLKTLLREGDKAPPQFAWPKDTAEPYIVVRQVVDLMKFHQRVMNYNFKKIESEAVSSLSAIASAPSDSIPSRHAATALAQATSVNHIQARWCTGEGPELFKERWEKLFKEFADADKVDPSKISELYDTMKFDALHNRPFLEWVFTPDASFLDEETPVETGSRQQSDDSQTKLSAVIESPMTEASDQSADKVAEKAPERGNIAQRMGFRRRSEVAMKPPVPIYPHESYFKLFTGPTTAADKAKVDARLVKLREMYHLCKVLFDYIGPQEYGITNEEKLEIGLLTSLPLLKEIVEDLEELQASDAPKCFFYFTKESHIYTLLNCILEGGIRTKIERNAIPELDYLSQINFELYESENATADDEPNTFNYSIRITISPGCHTFSPLDVQLDSRHMIGFAPRRSLTAHQEWKGVLETLREKFHAVKLPKSFIAINLSEKVPDAFRLGGTEVYREESRQQDILGTPLPSPALKGPSELEGDAHR